MQAQMSLPTSHGASRCNGGVESRCRIYIPMWWAGAGAQNHEGDSDGLGY
jgi:hypothetical protein